MTARATETDVALHRLDGDDDPPRGPHVALVGGDEAPLIALDLPQGLRGQAREDVARRQLRDMFGAESAGIELRPFHVGRAEESWTRALIADRRRLADWRTRTAPGCRAVLPDYLALPAAEGVWVLDERTGGTVRARLGLQDGFTADAAAAQAMLKAALASARAGGSLPRAVLLSGGRPAWARALLHDTGIAMAEDAQGIADLGLPRPRVLSHGETAFDLRRDPQAARDRLRRRVLPWRWPALAALIAAGLWAAGELIASNAALRAADARNEAIVATVRDHFVPSGPLIDIRTQVSRAMVARRTDAEAWRSRASPLILFRRAAGIIAAEGALTEEIAFDRDRGLVAVLRLPDFAAVDRLVGALADAGLLTEILGSRVSDGAAGVRAELRIGEGGA